MLIGQTELKKYIDSSSAACFPKTILFIGPKGCGKHSFASYVSQKLNLPISVLDDNLTAESLNDITISPSSSIYTADLTTIAEKKQNCLLKFIEEPPASAYIILMAENKNQVIPTVLNRCFIFEFSSYSKEELLSLIDDKEHASEILDFCSTPGQIKSFNIDSYNNLKDLSTKFIQYYDKVSLANLFNIVSKLNTKSNGQSDIELFLKLIQTEVLEQYKTTKQESYMVLYNLTAEYVNKLLDSRLNQETLIYNYLTKAWILTNENK